MSGAAPLSRGPVCLPPFGSTNTDAGTIEAPKAASAKPSPPAANGGEVATGAAANGAQDPAAEASPMAKATGVMAALVPLLSHKDNKARSCPVSVHRTAASAVSMHNHRQTAVTVYKEWAASWPIITRITSNMAAANVQKRADHVQSCYEQLG